MNRFQTVPPYYQPQEFGPDDIRAFRAGEDAVKDAVKRAKNALESKIPAVQNALRALVSSILCDPLILCMKDVPIIGAHGKLYLIQSYLFPTLEEMLESKTPLNIQKVIDALYYTEFSYRTNALPFSVTTNDDLSRMYGPVVVEANNTAPKLAKAFSSYNKTLQEIQSSTQPYEQDLEIELGRLREFNVTNNANDKLDLAFKAALESIKAKVEAKTKSPSSSGWAQACAIRGLCNEIVAVGGRRSLDCMISDYYYLKGTNNVELELIKQIVAAHEANKALIQTRSYREQGEELIRFAQLLPAQPDTPFSPQRNDFYHFSSEPEDKAHFVAKKEAIVGVIHRYIDYNKEHCKFSIFHRHGKKGRIRAEALIRSIDNLRDADINALEEEIGRFILDKANGNTHPHSLRTLLFYEINNMTCDLKTAAIYLAEQSEMGDKQVSSARHI